MSEELKPCPFCGGKAVMLTREDISGLHKVKIKCTNCFARTADHSYWNKKNEESAINKTLNAWNYRKERA